MILRYGKAIRGAAMLGAALSLAGLHTGCKPNEKASPTPTAVQLKGSGESYVEITAAASAPLGGNGPCKDGMILAGAGDGTERVLMGSLRAPWPDKYDAAEWNQTSWKQAGSLPTPPTAATELPVGSDNQTATLANGDLLLMWNGGTLAPLPDGSSLSWWNDWHTENNTTNEQFVGHPLFPDGKRNGFRGALILWRYSCAQGKWLGTTMLDAGMAQPLDQNNKPQKGLNAYYAPYAGFDREELYVDPWGVDPGDKGKQRIYVSTRIENDVVRAWQVFMSPDTGANWNPAGIKLNGEAPVAMTSTLGGRLFMLHPGDHRTQPALEWSDDYGASLSSSEHGYDISYINPKPKPGEQTTFELGWLGADVTGVGAPAMGMLSLARTWPDSVLAVYPAIEEVEVNGKKIKRQVAAVVWVGTYRKEKTDKEPVVVPVKIIRAQVPEGSVIMASFIQDERATNDVNHVATNMLYWLETASAAPASTTDPVKMLARRLIFVGLVPDTEKTLSDPAGWEMNNRKTYKALGDYMKGGFYAYKGTMNFVAVWPQVPATATAKDKTQAYMRIVTVADSVKATPPPTPGAIPGSHPAPHAAVKPAYKP